MTREDRGSWRWKKAAVRRKKKTTANTDDAGVRGGRALYSLLPVNNAGCCKRWLCP